MANKKTQAMAEFYRQCKQKGYTDMTDDTQSLKAKVIASDLGLRYSDISTLFEKAQKCSEEVAREAAEASKKRRANEELEREKAKELAIPGTLLLTFTDTVTDSEKSKKVRVYRRPNDSIYYTVFDGGTKIEGTPSLTVCKSEAYGLQYHPSQTVYTGATVGGITTGGFHETKAYTTMSSQSSGNGFIELHYKISGSESSFTVERVIVPEDVQRAFHRDQTFHRFITSEGIIFCSKTNYKDPMAELAMRSGNAYAAMTVLSAAVDKSRLPRQTCEEICALLQRILRGDYPETDEQIYARAIKLSEAESSGDIKKALDLFDSISDYSNARQSSQKARAHYEEVLQSEKEAAVLRREANKRKARQIATILTPITAVVIAFLVVLNTVIIPNAGYNKALAMKDSGDYEAAIEAFEAMDGYKDSVDQIESCTTAIQDAAYEDALALKESRDYEAAITAFEALEGYKDSADQAKECSYEYAVDLKEAGDYESAMKAFILLGEYKDSDDQVKECTYSYAVSLKEDGDYESAIATFEVLNGYKDSADQIEQIKPLYYKEILSDADVGDYIYFGTYEQDNNTKDGKEDIEWLVLAKGKDRVLITSRYALDCRPYNTSNADVTWEECSLREWLNSTFINEAFNEAEKSMIPTATVSADNNPKYNTDPGNSTLDQVFLLSITEAEQFFSSSSERICEPTAYANVQGCNVSDGSNCSWWLRSPGFDQWSAAIVNNGRSDQYYAATVSYDGSIKTGGARVDVINSAVRPALWIDFGA